MTNHRLITSAVRDTQRLLDNAPQWLEVGGLRVELAKCQPGMRRWLLQYASPQFSTNSPLAAIEAAEAEHIDRAATELTLTLLAEGRDDEAIEDALASLREHLGEHFRQRKLARLYEGR